MEENKVPMTEKTEWNFTKKTDGYSENCNNYVIPHELTVTITLNEYRELIRAASQKEISEYKSKWLDEYQKRQNLEKENERLRRAIAALQKKDSEPEKGE